MPPYRRGACGGCCWWLTAAALAPPAAAAPAAAGMRAVVATGYVGSDFTQLSVARVPTPRPGAGEVLVRVAASSVNPLDWELVAGFINASFPLTFPQRLGMDVVGTVAAVGPGAARLRVGDRVWGCLLAFGNAATLGAYAEYVVAAEDRFGGAPAALTDAEAGSLPSVAQTMYEALADARAARGGGAAGAVFITSCTGGTGYVGVQLAKRAFGATSVTCCASGGGVGLARSLGADAVLDYTKQNWWEVLGNDSVDVFIDNHRNDAAPDLAMPKMRAGGVFVSLAPATSKTPKPGVAQVPFILNATGHGELDALAALYDAKELRAMVDKQFPATDIASAFSLSAQGQVATKIGITVDFARS